MRDTFAGLKIYKKCFYSWGSAWSLLASIQPAPQILWLDLGGLCGGKGREEGREGEGRTRQVKKGMGKKKKEMDGS